MTSSHRIGGARRVFVVGVNLASALTVAVLAAPAAAGIWSAPTPPRPCPAAYAFDAAGHGVAAFGLQQTVGEDQSPPKLQGVWSSLSADGAYGPANQFAFEPTALALFGRAGLAIVGYSGRNGRLLPPYRSEVAVGSTRTGLGRAQVLGALRYRVIAPPRLAVDRAGRALVVYGGTRTRRHHPVTELFLSGRAPGGRFRRLALLARGRDLDNQPQLAGNARGEAVAAWHEGASVYARIRTAAGRLLPRQRLGRAQAQATLSAAVDAGGRALVAWTSAPPPAGQMADGPKSVRVAFRAPGARFGPARRLETMTRPAVFAAFADVETGFADRRAIIAWTGGGLGASVVRVQLLGRDGARRARLTLSPPGAYAHLSALAVARGRATVVSWATSPGSKPYASVAAPLAAGFGAPEPIGDASTFGDANVAIDPLTGNVVATGAVSPGCWTSVRRAT